MPTKVLDLDLAHPPELLEGLTGYGAVYALVRWNDMPVGRVRLPLRLSSNSARTYLTRDQLLAAICPQLDRPFADAWLEHWLGYDGRPNPSPLPSATVAVCTRDRPDDLARCLASLLRLHPDGQQVLVVDSASKGDATRRVVARFEGVRYVREAQPGLDRARNRALREADTEIVAFIDDDATADPHWLAALLRNFDDPEVMCVTGLTMPVELETRAQEDFERAYPFARGFRRKVWDRRALPPSGAGFAGAGVNMALRRRVLDVVGAFDEALDAGTRSLSSGDTDIFAQILSRDYLIVYEQTALNWHRHRRTESELIEQAYSYGAGPYAEFTALWMRDRDPAGLTAAFQWLLWGQLPRLARALLRVPGAEPLYLVAAELRGCPTGPRRYIIEKRQQAANQTSTKEPGGVPHVTADAAQSAPSTARVSQTVGVLPEDAGSNQPTLSVIIPSYNRSASLRLALASLCGQDYPPDRVEVVVVLDGGSDDSAAMLRGADWPFRLRVVEQANQGISAARNTGAAHATGQVLVFMDDDMEARPAFLAAHAAAHVGCDRRVVTGYFVTDMGEGKSYFADQLRNWWGALYRTIGAPGRRRTYTDILGGNMSLPKHLFDQVGGFHVPLLRHMEYELAVRLLAAGAELTFSREAETVHHERSGVRKTLLGKMYEGMDDVIQGQLHPSLRPVLPMARLRRHGRSPIGIIMHLAFRLPASGDRLAAFFERALAPTERVRRYFTWSHLLTGLMIYWYWRGVASKLGSLREVDRFLAERRGTQPEGEFIVRLDGGMAAAAACLDEARPTAAAIYYRDRLIGRIPPLPATEPLAGRHLAAIMRQHFPAALLSALADDHPTGQSLLDARLRQLADAYTRTRKEPEWRV